MICSACFESGDLQITLDQYVAYLDENDLDPGRMDSMQLQASWEKAVLHHHDLRPPANYPGNNARERAKPKHRPEYDQPGAEDRIMGVEPAPMPMFHITVEEGRVEFVPNPPRVLTKEEERVLLSQYHYALWRGWDDVSMDRKERMVRYNLRYAVKFALKNVGGRLDLPMRYSLCAEAIMRAVEDFDIFRDLKFSTYANWKLRGAISHARRDSARALRSFPQWPEVKLAKDVKPIERGMREAKPADKMAEIEFWSDFEHKIDSAPLTLIQRKVFNEYWGRDGGAGGTLKQVGEEVGLTRERVRQILQDCYVKIRGDKVDTPAEGD